MIRASDLEPIMSDENRLWGGCQCGGMHYEINMLTQGVRFLS